MSPGRRDACSAGVGVDLGSFEGYGDGLRRDGGRRVRVGRCRPRVGESRKRSGRVVHLRGREKAVASWEGRHWVSASCVAAGGGHVSSFRWRTVLRIFALEALKLMIKGRGWAALLVVNMLVSADVAVGCCGCGCGMDAGLHFLRGLLRVAGSPSGCCIAVSALLFSVVSLAGRHPGNPAVLGVLQH